MIKLDELLNPLSVFKLNWSRLSRIVSHIDQSRAESSFMSMSRVWSMCPCLMGSSWLRLGFRCTGDRDESEEEGVVVDLLVMAKFV